MSSPEPTDSRAPTAEPSAKTTTPITLRRQRAPTITIDTTSGDRHDGEDQGQSAMMASTKTPELRPSPSVESHRPASTHNVSVPPSKWTDVQSHNFLAVPATRSRGNSIDSVDQSHPNGSTIATTSVTSLDTATDQQSTEVTGLANEHIIKDAEALSPDPGTEAEYEVNNNKFAYSPGQLGKLFNPKSLGAFYALGGIHGLAKGLRTDLTAGLSADEQSLDGTVSFEEATSQGRSEIIAAKADGGQVRRNTMSESGGRAVDPFCDRKRIFGTNSLPSKKPKTIFELAWIAYNDKVLILLTVAAVISLALGIYQSVRPRAGEAPVEWVEGVAIIVAIVIVVTVGAANDWQKERQFVKLNRKKDNRTIKVIRSGKSKEISVHDILVGEIMHLEPGDMIPVDGIFISGHNVKCDESSATGESDLLRKTAAGDVFKAIEEHSSLHKMDPFIISGAKVEEGVGTFLVTAVGVHSSFGRTLLSLREDPQITPLQCKLNRLAEYIAKLGLAAGLILFTATFIKFLVSITGSDKGLPPNDKGQQFLQVFIVAVTIIVVAVPEGLPLAVTLALAFATTRMLKDNNLVRLLRACETMGNATTVCSDKTGTLTQNRMSTVAGTIGSAMKFGDRSSKPPLPVTKIHSSSKDDLESPDKARKHSFEHEVASDPQPEITDVHESAISFASKLGPDVADLFKQSVALNSTAFESDGENGEACFVGSKTETALLSFARSYFAMPPLSEVRSHHEVVQMVPFDSRRKCMAVVIKLASSQYRLLVKGASEIVLARCSQIIRDPTQDTSAINITHENLSDLNETIEAYASRSLRTIGLLYKDFGQWPPKGAYTLEDDAKSVDFDKIFKDMTFFGVVGLQDPLRIGVAQAVRACQGAGVVVRMVTGDNLMTAKAIALECGIYKGDGLVMEGPQFRKLSRREMRNTVPKLQVLARSSPEDKRILVKCLKEMGETVAVTGDGTNDAPALKTADVGFSMGIAGTEVAKEASDIILMDDNFASIVKAIMWGRAVNDSVKKFLQFQLTVNIVAVILTFVSAVANEDEASVLTAVQLLWVNLIMDTFAALALATDPPTRSILDRPPEPKSSSLISLTMWKMIIGQSIFQLAVTFILYFAGGRILSYGSEREREQLPTLIFNVFVFMQIVNQYNCRRIDNKFNIFEGILRNNFFAAIQFVIVGGQVLIVFVGGRAFSTHRLNGAQWAYSIILPLFTLPFGMIIRMIPDEFISQCTPAWLKKKAAPTLMITDEDRQYEWNPALENIREELTFLKRIRGGRLSALRYRLQHPREMMLSSSRNSLHRTRSRTNSTPGSPAGEPADPEPDAGGLFPPSTPESRRPSSGIAGGRSPRIARSHSGSAFGPAAAMAGVIAGSIAGWSPVEKREEESAK